MLTDARDRLEARRRSTLQEMPWTWLVTVGTET
jgi:hypothetical protein